MKIYAWLYYFYRTALMRTIRLFIFSLLLATIVYQLSHRELTPLIQSIFNIFLMIEVFFHYKVSRVSPAVSLEKANDRDIFASFTLSALYGFVAYEKTSTIAKKLVNIPSVQTMMQKANITKEEMKFPEVTKEDLAKSAFDTARIYNGRFVTALDVFLAYLFLTENGTKLLFYKKLQSDDIKQLALFIRREFASEEKSHQTRVRFEGGGIGEALVSGWTYETRKYTDNFTAYALQSQPILFGREKEFRSMLEGLVKFENNNILLVGDIGSGRENLVRALAYYSFEGHLGASLNHRRVYQLLVGPLTAGVTNRSDLEIRLENIIAEISHANDVILYIPDFQNIVGASSYNLDLSGALLPYLKAGNMPVVATMTTGMYKTYMEHNPLKETFNTISLIEPQKETAIQMVLGTSKLLEKRYGIIFTYQSITTAIDLASRFLQDATLPGNALSLLETVANSVSLSSEVVYYGKTRKKLVFDQHVITHVEQVSHVTIGTPTKTETDLLLNLEEKLHERVIGQKEALVAIAEAIRRVRSGVETNERPISFLFLGPTGVGKTETAKALSEIYYGGENYMIRLDMSEYTDEVGVKRLLGSPPGEGNERGELTDKIHDYPSSLILLDEFEKAHPQIHNLFLQVLDDGRLTDNKGVTVSFRNALIIATSNAGSEFIREEVQKGTAVDKAFHQKLLDYLQTKAIFKPELLNRFDDVVTFRPLTPEEVKEVARLMIEHLQKTLSEQDIKLVISDDVITKIVTEGSDRDFGARPLRRYIQDTIEDMIAQKKLTNELVRGKTATFSLDAHGTLRLTIS